MAEETPKKVSDAAKREEEILAFWEREGVFEKTLSKESPKGEFIFYEGPPTANGRPGIHHIEARAFKDIIPRFRTMQGYHVRRKGGWDTHGLPVELEVEKKLGLKSKKDIEAYGIAAFNTKSKESVWEYVDEWEEFTKRIAYWVDTKDPYVTYDPKYIESLWSIVRRIHDRGLLYKDYKVVPWCARCGTALSSHELAQGYADVKDLSVTAKFKVKHPEKLGLSGNVYLLAWTTTPWTLPGNVALAVGNDIQYVQVQVGDDIFILAEDRMESLAEEMQGTSAVVGKVAGKDLIGLEYEPLYPYLTMLASDTPGMDKAYQVYAADFVTTEDGTGIVHTAVMYGQDDFELGTAIGLPKYHLVDDAGHFIKGTDFLEGRFVKDEETAVEIIKDLAHRGLLFKKEKYEHSYPFCWRCKTPLIYYARTSWYVRMSSLRDELVAENEKIHWEPEHIKEGRFGEWLRGIKDWAISRERYWGTPLPVWATEDGKETVVIGSLEELQSRLKKSGNRYHVMRHGEAEHNVSGVLTSAVDGNYHLTEKGKGQVRDAIEKLKGEHIDYIYVSPLIRAQETASMIADALGIPEANVITEQRLHENLGGVFEGKPVAEWRAYRAALTDEQKLTDAYEGGESWIDIRKRMLSVLFELEHTHTDKNILFVGHGLPLRLMQWGALPVSGPELVRRWETEGDLQVGTCEPVHFVPFPHNSEYELDFHRPFIDEVVLRSDSGTPMRRTPEVMDVWFDSGSMPFAQDHYPFENREWVEGPGYPADYICEAIDQTRGWFYTLHAVGVLMGRGRAYKNVICLGHILDKEGKKMSKSVGNVVNPWEMISKYGVDVLRFWMYSVNQPGDSKNFDESTVDELVKKVFNLLRNVVSFYETYGGTSAADPYQSPHVLDRWVLAELDRLVVTMTRELEEYRVLEAVRPVREFVADLSQWYLRRSRDRFKSVDAADRDFAVATTRHVLVTLAKLMAPATPFIAEEVYQKTKAEGDAASVHLAQWPDARGGADEALLASMRAARIATSRLHELRNAAKINVRQPLAGATLKEAFLTDSEALKAVIAEEANIKVVSIDATLTEEVVLDTNLTPELKAEGEVRELMRHVQDMRKEAGLSPEDRIALTIDTDEAGQAAVRTHETLLTRTVGADSLSFTDVSGGELTLPERTYRASIEKR